eukprot:12930798-Prorocentrum_lima.AAC.1
MGASRTRRRRVVQRQHTSRRWVEEERVRLGEKERERKRERACICTGAAASTLSCATEQQARSCSWRQ